MVVIEASATLENPTVTRTVNDWYGDDDAGNPQNWPMAKKLFHSFIPICIGFLCPFGSSVYTPGSHKVMAEFSVSREVAILPFVVYLLGLAFGPILAAPVSETFGRKVVYITGLPIFAVFTIGAGYSRTIISFVVCRFFAGLFSSPGLSIGTGTIADVWPPEKRGVPMAVYVTTVQMGSALSPLLGGFVVSAKGWRWTQWVILFGLVVVLALTLAMSETYKTVILKRRSRKLGVDVAAGDDTSAIEKIKVFVSKTIARPIHMLLTEPIVTFFDIYVAFNFGLLNGFFAAFSYVFENEYGFSTSITGLTYLGQVVGSISGLSIVLIVYRFRWQPLILTFKETGEKMKPEQRLIVAKIGSLMLPGSLFWFGWTAKRSIHWISPVIAEGFFSCGNLLVFICASLYITDCYGAQYGASAWSSNTFSRYLIAAIFPLFVIQMYEALGIGWATSLLGFVSMALTPIPFLFDRYGERIRRRSKYMPGE